MPCLSFPIILDGEDFLVTGAVFTGTGGTDDEQLETAVTAARMIAVLIR